MYIRFKLFREQHQVKKIQKNVANILKLEKALKRRNCTPVTNGLSKKAPRGRTAGQPTKGQSWEELKKEGVVPVVSLPPTPTPANLSPNEEGAGTSELAGSSLTAN